MSELFKRNPLVAYFGITYLISWTIWSPIVASARGWVDWQVPYSLYYFGSAGPLLAAVIVTALTDGRAGIRNLFRRVFKFGVELRYYAFAVLVPIGLFTLAYIANFIITGTWSDLGRLGEADYLALLGLEGDPNRVVTSTEADALIASLQKRYKGR